MKNATAILGSLAAGAAGALLMYVFDPKSGRQRRALARDQVASANRKAREAISSKAKDVRNRAEDLAARLRAPNQSENDALAAAPEPSAQA